MRRYVKFFWVLMVLGMAFLPKTSKAEQSMNIAYGREYAVTINGEDRIDLKLGRAIDEEIKVKIYDVKTTYTVYSDSYEDLYTKVGTEANYLSVDSWNFNPIAYNNEHILSKGKTSMNFWEPIYEDDDGVSLAISNYSDKQLPTGENFRIVKTTFKILVTTGEVVKKVPATKLKVSKKISVTKGFKNTISAKLVNDEEELLAGLRWKSSNKKIATVDAKGRVKGKKIGKCKVYCTLKNGKRYTCKVTVRKNIYNGPKISKLKVSNYQYGEVALELTKAYYKGKKLIVKCVALNNRMFGAEKFKSIKLTIGDGTSSSVAKKKFKNVSLKIKPYKKKTITFVFPAKSVKKKKYDLAADDNLMAFYSYTYVYSIK